MQNPLIVYSDEQLILDSAKKLNEGNNHLHSRDGSRREDVTRSLRCGMISTVFKVR